MLLWDVGAALAISRYAFRDPAMDLRWLALGAVLPNLADKSVGSVLFWDHFRNGRIHAHTLIFAALVLAVAVVATGRGSSARRAGVALAVGVFLHLLLDGHFTDPESFLWPFFGWQFPAEEGQRLPALLADGSTSPLVLALEAAGAVYLGYLWRLGGLSDPTRRARFLRDGRIRLR
jgi:membrane-bound metal-dependent hydrolase YbcI (DUF457 family)